MWYLIAGRLMSYISFLVFFKLFNDLDSLLISEKFWGWFYIRHVFEEYNFTAGKFYIINNDFRTLIKNVVLIIRNFAFLAQAFTPSEFITINIVLICLLLFCNSNLTKDFVRIFVFVCYIYVLYCFLLIDLSFIYIFIKYLGIILSMIFSLFFYLYLIYLFIIKKFKNINLVQFVTVFILKFFLLIILNLLAINYWLSDLNFFFTYAENFAQEIAIKFLILYSYFYYF